MPTLGDCLLFQAPKPGSFLERTHPRVQKEVTSRLSRAAGILSACLLIWEWAFQFQHIMADETNATSSSDLVPLKIEDPSPSEPPRLTKQAKQKYVLVSSRTPSVLDRVQADSCPESDQKACGRL